MECQYCKNKFISNSSLKAHQKKAKYCLQKQGKQVSEEFTCEFCNSVFTVKAGLQYHYKICRVNKCTFLTEIDQLKKQCNEYINKNILLEKELNIMRMKEEELKKDKENLMADYAKLAAISASRDFEQHTVIEIEQDNIDEVNTLDEEYSLEPLDIGKGFSIQHREEDGYINVTDLCKAGGKKYSHWKSLEKSRGFIHALSMAAGIPAAELIQVGTGNKFGTTDNTATWVHPQVAINIAQWISPHFDVKVSAWVYEVMMTGKVDIGSTKSYRQLQSENKDKELQIRMLTKKYMKKQPRQEIPERNVIYILTTKLLKTERRYILGKAGNLTSRLSTYNKTDEHEIVYYQQCNDEDTMSTVENLIFSKLKNYREQANRERFILPPGKNISLFVDTVKECIKFIS